MSHGRNLSQLFLMAEDAKTEKVPHGRGFLGLSPRPLCLTNLIFSNWLKNLHGVREDAMNANTLFLWPIREDALNECKHSLPLAYPRGCTE